jgi:hypothetical protein
MMPTHYRDKNGYLQALLSDPYRLRLVNKKGEVIAEFASPGNFDSVVDRADEMMIEGSDELSRIDILRSRFNDVAVSINDKNEKNWGD